jgi:hypothetical protein
MFPLRRQDERPRRSGPSDLGDDEDDDGFFRRPRPDSFFSLGGPVSPGKRNDPRDVIKVQTLLGNADRGSFGRFQGPLGILQDADVEGIKDWQSRNRLTVDGFLNPAGETIRSMRKSMGTLLGAFKAPTPDEVDEHHAGTRGLGEEKLVRRQPFLKIGGDGKNLPEVPGEDTIHIAKAVNTLGRYSDPGDHPRWTARDIGAEGAVALARTRDMLRQLQEKSPELADAYLRKLFTFPLPQGTREALTGQSEPERVPVGVLKDEWEKHRTPDFVERRPCTPRPPGSLSIMPDGCRVEPRSPHVFQLAAGTDAGDGAGHGQPKPDDDPEARERKARVERTLRRRAERSGEDPEEAIRDYWKSQRTQVSEPPAYSTDGRQGPGEEGDPNSRLESLEEPPDLTPEAARKSMEDYADYFKQRGWPDAEANLRRYLEGKGGERIYTREEARAFAPIRKAEAQNQDRFENGTFLGETTKNPAPRALKTMKEGQKLSFRDDWSRDYKEMAFAREVTLGDKNFAFAHGQTKVRSDGMFVAKREGDTIRIEGIVTHSWDDKYDFDRGQPGGAEAKILEGNGQAKEFKMKSAWRQQVSGTVDIVNGKLTNPRFKWTDLDD